MAPPGTARIGWLFARGFFGVAGLALARGKRRSNCGDINVTRGEQHEQMIDDIAGLTCNPLRRFAHSGKRKLDGLLAEFPGALERAIR